MNLLLIDKEYQKLNVIEDYINYKFEPRSKSYKCKRHIYYNDLKNDFVDEVNAYGFSPFIQETYDNQRKDKNIMRFKTNFLNQGLINYVKKKNKNENGPSVIHYKLKGDESNKKMRKLFPKSARYFNKRIDDENTNPVSNANDLNVFNIVNTNQTQKNQKENFLQKALENLARNKLNISEDSNIFSNEKENRRSAGIGGSVTANNFNSNNGNNTIKKDGPNITNKELNFDQLKMNYINSLHYKVDLNPIISISNFSQPEPLKVNFERFFKNAKLVKKKSIDNHAELKKLVGLFKNKDVIQNLRNLKKEMQEKEDKFYERAGLKVNEINRDSVDLKSSIKISSKSRSRQNVFKKLYSLSQFGTSSKFSKGNNVGSENMINKMSSNSNSRNKHAVEKNKPSTSSFNNTNAQKDTANSKNKKSINQLYIENIKNLNNRSNLLKHNQDTDHINEEMTRKIIDKSPYSLIKKVNLKMKGNAK